jgi:hypothetical protein
VQGDVIRTKSEPTSDPTAGALPGKSDHEHPDIA